MWSKIILFVVFSGISFGESEVGTGGDKYVINVPVSERNGMNQFVSIKFRTSVFIAADHKIEVSNDKYGLKIDGKPAIGVDGIKAIDSGHKEVICSMDVEWNGKNIKVDPNLFGMIFNHELHRITDNAKTPDSGINATESDDGKKLMIRMTSHRFAACGYTVYWIIDSKGKTIRFVELLPL